MSAQTTRGQKLGEKPPEVATVYGSDGSPHSCSPLDAREILAAGLGYSSEPPAKPSEAKVEQQPEQQPKHGDGPAGSETIGETVTKPDNPSDADSNSKTAAGSRGKARSRKQ